MSDREYKTDWKNGDVIPAEDLNRIEENMKEIDEKIEVLEHREVTNDYFYTIYKIGNVKKIEIGGNLPQTGNFSALEEIGVDFIVVTGIINSQLEIASVALPVANNLVSFSLLPSTMAYAHGVAEWRE